MNRERLEEMLGELATGQTDVASVVKALSDFPGGELGYAHVDTHRALRRGFPEVVFSEGKTPDQMVGIVERLSMSGDNVLLTRVSDEQLVALKERLPSLNFESHPPSTAVVVRQHPEIKKTQGRICVLCAGTSDLSVAVEAVVTARLMGNEVELIADVGVAGIHRVLGKLEEIRSAQVLIVVAGMDGALPSVVAGLVEAPVIAVPTSIGYGASFEGLGALLTMLNSCAAGVTVVNIDNGFGAAYSASLMMRNGPGVGSQEGADS